MITVQQLRSQIADLERQRDEISSKPTTDFKKKVAFLEKHIGILQDAANEISRLNRQAIALSYRNDELNWLLQNSERNHTDTKKQNNRFAHTLAVAGLPPYSIMK